MKKIHTDDTVIVIAGKFLGSTGKVLSIQEDKIYIEGINILQSKKKGPKHHALHISNVAYFDTKIEKKISLGIKNEDGKNVRFNKKTGSII